MSRQPRKVFGFTGAAKYGPVADGEEGDKDPLVTSEAPPSQDMKRKENKNNSSNSLDCYYFWCDPKGFCCSCITCWGVCRDIDCSGICP